MKKETLLAFVIVRDGLSELSDKIRADTEAVVLSGDLPALVTHFDKLRDVYDTLKMRMDTIDAEISKLSYEIIPTMFGNNGVKSLKVEGVGNVFVSARWNASMIRRDVGMNWLRETGNGGLITETVNASTLAAFAKDKALSGEPLPDAVFKVGTAPYTSIRRS